MLDYTLDGVVGHGDDPSDDTLFAGKITSPCETEVELHFPSGSRYVGSVQKDQLSGYGKYYYVPGGDVYEGEWEAGMKHGHGTYTYASGDRYVGEWYQGKKRGRGRYSFANGDEYLGFWKDDKIHGYGVFSVKSSGNRYEGFWEDACRHGHGVFYHTHGDVYDGNWVRGKEEGLGILIQSNGSIYCGEWKQGEMEGKGVLRVQRKLYAVDYVNGCAASQVPIAEGERPAAEWLMVYDHYMNYMSNCQLHDDDDDGRSSSTRKLDEFRHALERLKVECALWRKRYEGLVGGETASNKPAPDVPAVEQTHEALQVAPRGAEAEQAYVDQLKPPVYRIETSLLQQGRDEKVANKGGDAANSAQNTTLSSMKVCSIPAVLTGQQEMSAANKENTPTEKLRHDLIMLRQHNVELMRKNRELESQRAAVTAQKEAVTQTLSSHRAKLDALEAQLIEATVAKEEASMDAMTLRTRARALEIELGEREKSKSAHVGATPQGGGAAAADDDGGLVANLERVNRENAELHRRCEALEKDLRRHDERYNTLANVMRQSDQAEALVELRMEVKKLESQLGAAEEALRTSKVELDYRNSRHAELESLLLATARRKTTDPNILRSLDRKMDHLRALQESNAELSRQLEESKGELEIYRKGRRAARERTRSAEQHEANLEEELAQLRRDLKREQKRHKKVSANQEALTAELYEEQVQHARAKRTLQSLQGRLTVVARIRGGADGDENPCVYIDNMDHSQLLLANDGDSDGERSRFQFDLCFDANTTWEAMFNEVCSPITAATRGFHVAYVVLGAIHTGKTTMLARLLPLVANYLCTRCRRYSTDKYAVSYKVAAVEVGVSGAIDSATSTPVTAVRRDTHGFVVPSGVTFLDTTDVDMVSTVERLRLRQQQNHRSHMWIQIQCTILHRIHRTFTVGRVTLVDLCGPGPLLLQEDDLESARFANRSFGHLMAVLEALRERQTMVPYTESLETALLSDVFGGNAMTTVVGTLSCATADVGDCRRTLHAMKMASEVVNGPLLPQFVSGDELRWRNAVAAACSAEVAQPLLVDVSELQDL